MSFLRETWFSKDWSPGVPILERADMNELVINTPYPRGYDPSVLGQNVGTVVSANNQRPEGWPACAVGALPLTTSYLPSMINDDTRFQAVIPTKMAEPTRWKTNSQLIQEFDTYADGVQRFSITDNDTPSAIAEAYESSEYYTAMADMYDRQADIADNDQVEAEHRAQAIQYQKMADDILRNAKLAPNQNNVQLQEGAPIDKYAYGVAPPAPYQIPDVFISAPGNTPPGGIPAPPIDRRPPPPLDQRL